MTYVLDTSAYFRFLDQQAGGARVAGILQLQQDSIAIVQLSAIHWGEICGVVTRRRGTQTVDEIRLHLSNLGIQIVPADAPRAQRAALLVVELKIPYADAFGVELASDSPEHVLVTADFDVKPAASKINIEFLPPNPKQ